MKILHTADWHIGQFKGPVVDGVNLRSQDTVKCLEYMVQVAIEEKPDIVCVSGDIFHQEQVGPVRYSDEMITASVVVPYETESYQLLEELSQVRTETEKKKILRKLQRYMVGISEIRKDKLGNAIYETSEGILVLSDGYYDKKVGVVDEPKMDFCNM